MGWAILPTAGVDWKSWDFLAQFSYAIRERFLAAGAVTWPRSAWIYDSGIITAISNTSVTIGGKVWSTSPQRWVAYSGPVGWEAADYDLIIDDCDPRKVIRSAITAQPSADTVTIDDITQRITERVAPSIASLAGKVGVIIGRGNIWWSDRWIEWPNDPIFTDGTVITAAAGTIESSKALRHRAGLVGKDILFFNTLGILQRGRITAIAGNTFTFSGTAGTAQLFDYFAVVAADGYYQAQRVPPSSFVGRPKSFYRGAQDLYYSHWPDDSLSATKKPAATRSFEYGVAFCTGIPDAYTVLDVDLWVPQDNICGLGDYTFSPDLYKTIRGWWDALIDVCTFFVAGNTRFVAATWFNAAGINSQTSTAGTHTLTGLPVALATPWLPYDVWYAVLADDGTPQTSGIASYDGTEIAGSFADADDGKNVVVSLGPTRWVPRMFRRMRDITGFLPDVDTDPVWPPTEGFPGRYETLPASTHYLEALGGFSTGVIVEATRAEDAFADGDLARYVGDNWDDPTTSDPFGSGVGDLTPWRDRFFNGRRTRAIQSQIDFSTAGYAVGGSTTQLSSPFDWWGVDFWTPGAVFVRSGTATSGSTTTLADTVQAGSAFWNDSTRNQTGMVVTVTNPADSTEHKRLITAHAGTTITFTPALPFAVAVGTAYAIRETDGRINRWKGLMVAMNKPDPATPGATLTATATISGNDDATIFFPAIAWPVDDTTRFKIQTEKFGGVWLRASGAWTVPVGNDLRAPNPPFRKSQPGNLETMVKRYGLPNLRDYSVLVNFVELKAGLSVLNRTPVGVSWVSQGEDSHRNGYLEEDYIPGDFGTHSWTWTERTDDAASTYASYTPDTDDRTPLAISEADKAYYDNHVFNPSSTADSLAHINLDRACGYEKATLGALANCSPAMSAIDWYVYGWIDIDNHPAGAFDTGNPDDDWIYVFDDNGDPIAYHAWTLFDSTVPVVGDNYSAKFGSLVSPPFTVEPVSPTVNDGRTSKRFNGYYVGNQMAVIEWAMVYD